MAELRHPNQTRVGSDESCTKTAGRVMSRQ
jgi:hypothetical protein